MRYVRGLVVVMFVVALGLWGWVKYQAWSQADTHMPVIMADPEQLSVSVRATRDELMEGIHAWDEEDGDITDQVIVGNYSNMIGENACYLNYVVFDTANHSTTFRRIIQFQDYHAPQFQLTSPLVFPAGEEPTSILPFVKAEDVFDGDITGDVLEMENTVDSSQEKLYYSVVQVTNRLGDTATLRLPIHILYQGETALENALPLVYVPCGFAWSEEECLKMISGQLGEIQVTSEVDTTKAGAYEIHFQSGQQHTWTTVVVYE